MNQNFPSIEWQISDHTILYPDAVACMEKRVAEIRMNVSSEIVFLLEHPPLYTAGTSADPKELLDPNRLPVYQTGRGGKFTYHGPGQRVAYAMLDLKRRGRDIRRYVNDLEQWAIETLAQFSIVGERRPGRIGIWVKRSASSNPLYREDKIVAIGVRVRKWVAFHGISLNVDPDLTHFEGIVPCGIDGYGVTSLWDLGINASMPEVDTALRLSFEKVFGRTTCDATTKQLDCWKLHK